MKLFGASIAQLRKECGFTQESLARELGVTKQTISNYESDKRRPDYEMLEAICDALNVSMECFLSKEEQEAELGEIYKKYPSSQSVKQSEPLYISVSSGNKVTDELRKLLHAMVDRLGDGDVRLLTDIAKRLQTHEPAVPFKQIGVAFNPVTGQKLPAFELVCDGTAETKFAAKLEQAEMVEDNQTEQVTPV